MKQIVNDELNLIYGGVSRAKTPLSPLPQPLPPADSLIRMPKPKPNYEVPVIRIPIFMSEL